MQGALSMFKVVIAEDDLSSVELLEQVLIENGYRVCGVARTVDYAVELIERYKPDFAILDLVLSDGRFGTEIGAKMRSGRRPGILYATGYPNDIRFMAAHGEACIGKPYRAADILSALQVVNQIMNAGLGPRPYPGGLSVLAHRVDIAENGESRG